METIKTELFADYIDEHGNRQINLYYSWDEYRNATFSPDIQIQNLVLFDDNGKRTEWKVKEE